MKSTAIFTYLFLMSGNNGILTILQYDIFFYAKKWDFGSGNFLHSEINMLKLFKSKTIKYSVKVIRSSNSKFSPHPAHHWGSKNSTDFTSNYVFETNKKLHYYHWDKL